MSKQEKFVDFINANGIMDKTTDEEILSFWEELKKGPTATTLTFTKNGKAIIAAMRLMADKNDWTSGDIAAMIDATPRSVSSSIRKLITDELVEKVSKEPVLYALTNKGKEIKFY